MWNLEPLSHQLEEYNAHKKTASRMVLWEQGTGKSKLCIDIAQHLYRESLIDCVVVLAPPGVDRVWYRDQLDEHLIPEVSAGTLRLLLETKTVSTKKFNRMLGQYIESTDKLLWACVAYPSSITAKMSKVLREILLCRKTFLIMDESHYLKNQDALVTRNTSILCSMAEYKRVLTGTPTDGNPFDMYSQVELCQPGYWEEKGIHSFAQFKHTFAEIFIPIDPFTKRPRRYEKIKSFKNLPKLWGIVEPLVTRVRKKDVLDLPDKLYSKRYIALSTEQQAVYTELKEEYYTMVDGQDCSIRNVMSWLVKAMRVTCNHISTDVGDTVHIGKVNPKLEALKDIIAEGEGKFLVWTMFTEDIRIIQNEFGQEMVAQYYGELSPQERQQEMDRFKNDTECRVMVLQTRAGAEGLTLTEATTSVYYSNSPRLILRQQSEDRNHRIGQKNPVLYIDLVAHGTVEELVVGLLKKKQDVSNILTGDYLKDQLMCEK